MFGRGSAAGDGEAVGAGAAVTAAGGPGLVDDDAVADGLGVSDGPAVHAITRSPMAATSRPKPRLMPDTVAARLGGGVGDGLRIVSRPVRSTGPMRIAVPIPIHCHTRLFAWSPMSLRLAERM